MTLLSALRKLIKENVKFSLKHNRISQSNTPTLKDAAANKMKMKRKNYLNLLSFVIRI